MKKRRVKKSVKIFFRIFIVLILLISYYIFIGIGSYSLEISNTFNKVTKKTTVEVQKLNECMSEEYKEENFTEDLINKKNELINYYNGVNAYFMYTDLDSNYSFGKNETKEIYAASVSKLPAVLYTYKLADENKIDLNKELTYTSNYTAGGTGIIQNDKVGTKYKISTLLENAIKYSDNIAYFMILDEIGGKEKVKSYFKDLDINITYTDRFGNLSPKLGNEYISEVYKYYKTNNENAIKLVNDMKDSMNSDYVKSGDVEVAHKYGEYVEGGGYYNDVSLNFTTHPFALSITSTLGLGDKTKTFFLKSHSLAIEFNELYYKEKLNYCKNKVG